MGYLVVARMETEEVWITLDRATPEELARLLDGEPIVIRVISIRGDEVKLGGQAPRSVGIDRREVCEAKRREAAALAE